MVHGGVSLTLLSDSFTMTLIVWLELPICLTYSQPRQFPRTYP